MRLVAKDILRIVSLILVPLKLCVTPTFFHKSYRLLFTGRYANIQLVTLVADEPADLSRKKLGENC